MKTDILKSYDRPLQLPNIQSNERVVICFWGETLGLLNAFFPVIFFITKC